MNNQELRRELDDHIYPSLRDHEERLGDMEKWRERAKGFIGGVGLVASLPTMLLGWMALTGRIGQ